MKGAVRNTLRRKRPEWMLFAAVLLAANLPLLRGTPAEDLIFLPGRVLAGEWWRLLTFPWVHVSWYHLLLDGAAFLLLYRGLEDRSLGGRLTVLAGGAVGSLAAALAIAPEVKAVGLCGLSGVDHGMLAVSGVECIRSGDREARAQGALFLATVVSKAAFEAARGRVFFDFLHFGLMGVPVAACHLGGILGAVAVYAVLEATDRIAPAGRRRDAYGGGADRG